MEGWGRERNSGERRSGGAARRRRARRPKRRRRERPVRRAAGTRRRRRQTQMQHSDSKSRRSGRRRYGTAAALRPGAGAAEGTRRRAAMRGSGCGALPGRSEASEACVRARGRRRAAELACQGCAGAARKEIVVRGQRLPQPPAAPSPSFSTGREQAVVGPGLALQRLRSFSIAASARRRRRCRSVISPPAQLSHGGALGEMLRLPARLAGARSEAERGRRSRAAQQRLRTAPRPSLSPLGCLSDGSEHGRRCAASRSASMRCRCAAAHRPGCRAHSLLPLPAPAAVRLRVQSARRAGAAAPQPGVRGAAAATRVARSRLGGTPRRIASAC